MATEASRQAYDRYRFKLNNCYKTCMLHESRGGFCKAERSQVEHCLALGRLKKDNRDYRSEQTTLDWIEVFCEEKGMTFKATPLLKQRIADALVNSRKDCYAIAEKIVEEMEEQQCRLVQLQL